MITVITSHYKSNCNLFPINPTCCWTQTSQQPNGAFNNLTVLVALKKTKKETYLFKKLLHKIYHIIDNFKWFSKWKINKNKFLSDLGKLYRVYEYGRNMRLTIQLHLLFLYHVQLTLVSCTKIRHSLPLCIAEILGLSF